MEELLIEEKAKRYDEAIERAKAYQGLRSEMEIIFPELKEGEESIRKAIGYAIGQSTHSDGTLINGVSSEEALAWLEKQGEHANFRNKIQIGDKVTRNEDGVLVNLSQLNRVAKKQGEQKPIVNDNAKEMFIKALERVEEQNAEGYKLTDCDKNSWWEDFKNYTSCTIEQKPTGWSEKLIADVFEMVGLAKIVREQENDALTRALQSAMIELAKYSVVPQIRQEWSEEDEYCRHQLIVFCENCMVQDAGAKRCAHWLKSLRPQNTWKPCDEQMDALNYVVNLMASSERPTENDLYYNILKSLRQQLKKLREK